MAADTRPYKSKEQDGQGNEVIIRDQQLVEQSTVTTMPSGACFETLDIDGRPVKIPRDNMISIVLECMGIVLNDSSKNLGTNVNKALGLQGNTIGNVTVSDLASVLGGVLGFKKINDGLVTESGTTYDISNKWGVYFFVDRGLSVVAIVIYHSGKGVEVAQSAIMASRKYTFTFDQEKLQAVQSSGFPGTLDVYYIGT